MKFYVRTDADAKFTADRARYEADNIGRASSALERIAELIADLPENPTARFADGLVRLLRLGQGRAAYESFKIGYELAAKRFPEDRELARGMAYNAALLTTDEETFRCWADLAIQASVGGDPAADKENKLLKAMMSGLNRGMTRVQCLLHTGGHETGASAGALEIALKSGKLASSQYMPAYRERYLKLMKVDEQDMIARHQRGVHYPASERLALLEAARIIEKILPHASNDRTHWRMHAYVMSFLDRHEEALKSAQRGLALDLTFLDCHVCKSGALYRTGRREEAIAALDDAVRYAKNPTKQETEALQKLRASMNKPYHPLKDVSDGNDASMAAGSRAGFIALEELDWRDNEGVSLTSILDRLLTKPIMLAPQPAKLYVPLAANMLNDFTPETGFLAVRAVGTHVRPASRYLFLAVLYIASRSQGVMRRDAADLLMYLILASGGGKEETRKFYRECVLAVGEADEAIGPCDALIRETFLRHNIDVEKLLGKSGPVSAQERAKAEKLMRAQFSGDPPETKVGSIGWSKEESHKCQSIFHKETNFEEFMLTKSDKASPGKTDDEREGAESTRMKSSAKLQAKLKQSRRKPKSS